MVYDDGVDMFDTWNVPKYYNCSELEKEKQKEDVRNWIDRGGILLTHSQQFRGCESTNVVLVSDLGTGINLYVWIFWMIISILTLVLAFVLLVLLHKDWFYWAFAGISLLFFIIVGFLPRLFPRGNSLYRSNLTRAVAGLGYVVNERNVNREDISKHYDLHELVDNEC